MTKVCYYVLNETTKTLERLQAPVRIGGHLRIHLTPAQAAAYHAYTIADPAPAEPTPPEGKVTVPDSWEVSSGAWVRTYRYEDAPPPPPRTFSKLRLVAALTDAGVWAQAKALVEQVGLYDLFLAAQDFAEDNEFFAQGRAALQTALGWTDQQVDAVLAAAAV